MTRSFYIVFLLSVFVLGHAEQEKDKLETGQEDQEVDEDGFQDEVAAVGFDDPIIRAEFDEIYNRMQEEYANYTLKRISAGKVGRRARVTLSDGKSYVLKTLSIKPPIFEIKNYLSNEECDHLINVAKSHKMATSRVVGEEQGFNFEDQLNENQGLADIFKEFDQNADGNMDMSEVQLLLETSIDFHTDVQNITKLIQDCKIDKDGDEMISLAEFQEIDFANSTSPLLKEIRKIKELRPETKGRHSKQVFIDQFLDSVLEKLQHRLSELTRLPMDLLRASEQLQVVRYGPGGHYNCHLDSEEVMQENKICCHLSSSSPDNCQLCRYMTVLYFLNDVEDGGETAFPIADNTTMDHKAWEMDTTGLCNLASNCQKSNKVVKPEKGKAILWYNHLRRSGWLGQVDFRSSHGGCDVIKGEKWIANNWIDASPFRDEDIKHWAQRVIELKYPEDEDEDGDVSDKANDEMTNGDVRGMDEDSPKKTDHTEL